MPAVRTTFAKATRGAVAGAVGTVAMDALWYRRYRQGGGEDGPIGWEVSTGTDSFEDAGAPGQVGQMVTDLVDVEIPERHAGATTDVAHWMTGIGYGLGHALLNRKRGPVAGGLLTGVGAFLTSYAALGAADVYDPIWEYEPKTLAKDLSAHLLFGLATAAAFWVFNGKDR